MCDEGVDEISNNKEAFSSCMSVFGYEGMIA